MGALHRDHRPLVGRSVLPDCLGDDDDPAGLACRGADGLLVQRRDRPHVDHLDVDALGLEDLRRQHRVPDHVSRRDHGHVVARPLDVALAERDDVVLVGDQATERVQQLVLEEHDGVVVADRRLHQALRVIRGRGHHDLESRDVREPDLEALGVLGGRALAGAAALGHPQDPGHAALAAGHEPDLGRLGGDLIHREAAEVNEHDLGHRAHPDQRRAGRGADDRVLRDRRVADPLRPELVEQGAGDAERAPVLADVLAQQEHALVADHLLAERLADGLLVRHLGGRDTLGYLADQSRRHPGGRGPQGHRVAGSRRHRLLLTLRVDVVHGGGRVGLMASLRERDRRLDLCPHLRGDGVEFARGKPGLRLEEPAEANDRILRLPGVDLGTLAVDLRLPGVVAIEAIALRDEEGRSAPCPCSIDRLTGRIGRRRARRSRPREPPAFRIPPPVSRDRSRP